MQANIEDVAQLAGVSIATVSRTFKHPDVPYCPIAERSLCIMVQRTNLRGP